MEGSSCAVASSIECQRGAAHLSIRGQLRAQFNEFCEGLKKRLGGNDCPNTNELALGRQDLSPKLDFTRRFAGPGPPAPAYWERADGRGTLQRMKRCDPPLSIRVHPLAPRGVRKSLRPQVQAKGYD